MSKLAAGPRSVPPRLRPAWLWVLTCLTWFGFISPTSVSVAAVDFEEQIAPIFERHCLGCHSSAKRAGDLALVTDSDLRQLEYVVPGNAAASPLLEAIASTPTDEPRMPKDAEPLSENAVSLIKRWINEGAKWPTGIVLRERSKADASWWSLQPLGHATPPTVDNVKDVWTENPIDCFVLAELNNQGLVPNPPADRRTLIRRASYDLTGLPPTPEQVQSFVADPDPRAYEQLIDRLLDSPHYGERWGRHWLDVVRFGESNGFERNFIINDLWPFRDYVIRSLNEDKPFDQFIREHLAGDVFGKDQPAIEVGSAFLVAGPYDDVRNLDAVQAAQIRANTIDEIIRATGEAFLGLTVGCARCHDHKFDPISQQDYYSWYATFAGVKHGRRIVASQSEKAAHAQQVEPLQTQLETLTAQREQLVSDIDTRAEQRRSEYEASWIRPAVDLRGSQEEFPAVTANWLRLVSEGNTNAPTNTRRFDIDELEVWTAETVPRNVALASNGASASGEARQIVDFPGAYGPHLAIDGKVGERFLGVGGSLTIRFAQASKISRVFFSAARGEVRPDLAALAEYRIEVSEDGQVWKEIANSHDRRPVNDAHRVHRLRELEMVPEERRRLAKLDRQLAAVRRQLNSIPKLQEIWVGTRDADGGDGPFHVFEGGSPQRRGSEVTAASLSALQSITPSYETSADESQRRIALADWLVDPGNPLTPRVLANRIWHYHFGTGIVSTPSDFGYMGAQPTHPALLDYLARQLHENDWRLKPLHRLIMTSQVYRQSSTHRADAARLDGDARFLWRFPPRRLSAEEIRDTMLSVAGKLDLSRGGPGFRLYRFLQDNVATYEPLDEHGPETYRRAVYHQNARASVLDLMTDFDQPDCAFSTPKRASTTTPLQALTMLNHQFTVDMANFMADRLRQDAGVAVPQQIERAFQLCHGRQPSASELEDCQRLARSEGLDAVCRVLLNTSELIYVP